MRHFVLVSGSTNSLAAAYLVACRCREERLDLPTLIFADTGMEFDETYRLVDAAGMVAWASYNWPTPRLIPRSSECRTSLPWVVWLKSDKTPLNWINDFPKIKKPYPCCKQLKHDKIDAWLAENADPAKSIISVGITWPERCKFFGSSTLKGLQAIKRQQGWTYEAPLCGTPYWTPGDIADIAAKYGAAPHAMDGAMEHLQCGGFCYANGRRQWHRFLAENGGDYKVAENASDSARLIQDSGGGKFTLREFRQSNPGNGYHLPREHMMCFSTCLEQ